MVEGLEDEAIRYEAKRKTKRRFMDEVKENMQMFVREQDAKNREG